MRMVAFIITAPAASVLWVTATKCAQAVHPGALWALIRRSWFTSGYLILTDITFVRLWQLLAGLERDDGLLPHHISPLEVFQ